MATVTITLSDTEDGLVEQVVSYGEAFEADSDAHQFANMMLKLAGDAVRAQNESAPLIAIEG